MTDKSLSERLAELQQALRERLDIIWDSPEHTSLLKMVELIDALTPLVTAAREVEPNRLFDNHHNALSCPYCNPNKYVLVSAQEFAEQQREIERLTQELADERMMKEKLFMEPLLSREYPPLDPVEMRDENGKDLGLSIGAAMKWLVQRSHDADAAEAKVAEQQREIERLKRQLVEAKHLRASETGRAEAAEQRLSAQYEAGRNAALEAIAGAMRKVLAPESLASLIAALSPSVGEAQGAEAIPTDAERKACTHEHVDRGPLGFSQCTDCGATGEALGRTEQEPR